MSIFVVYRRGGIAHRYEDPSSTYCGLSLEGAKPWKGRARIARCKACERVATIRTDLSERKPQINRMALIRELVELRARSRAKGQQSSR